MKTFIIAEAGVNHNGDVAIARSLIDAAVEAGVDAVKFQTFRAEKLVSRQAPKAEYQTGATEINESQFEMLKKLELHTEEFRELYRHCRDREIIFMSTAFDLESVDMLDRLGLDIWKIPSGEINNLPYLRRIGGLGKKIIISTGMAELSEIKDALSALTAAGTSKDNITVLHCSTEYPAHYEDVNLRAMITIENACNVEVGYSDHTTGIEVPVAAVALGAAVIEKHFTLDKNMSGPDHRASLEPHELKEMVGAIRNIEKAMGDGVKRSSASEVKNKVIARKSIVASRYIKKGEILSEDIITVKRPGTGISPMEWDRVIGKAASRDFEADDLIEV
ncbi:MAG: N-acetylneuraminate synthase [Nitrospiraceae bacterium]|nr:MAG: N-acetylneuraminate synthase [Nitrospiraceae bacterium]